MEFDNNTIVGGAIGVAGTIIGSILSYFLQFRMNKRTEDKETGRLLIALKANIDAVSMDLFKAAVRVRLQNFNICYTTKVKKEGDNGNDLILFHYREGMDLTEPRNMFLREIEGYQEAVKQLKKLISEFLLYAPNKHIEDIFRQIKDYNFDYYKDLKNISIEDLVKINPQVEGKNSYQLVVVDFEKALLYPLEELLSNEVSKYIVKRQ